MRLAIMQPYLLPYLGYFQLIESVDLFVVYDNIEYTKKGWINRNRLMRNGAAATFTLPLKAGSDFLDIRERELAGDFNPRKFLNQFRGAYAKAPCFVQTMEILERIVHCGMRNLFDFLYHSLSVLCPHMGINRRLAVSSSLDIDHRLKRQERVLAICRSLGASTYVNAIGGVELYSREAFASQGIDLKFIHSLPFEYPQFGETFVPSLSIVDVLMFNPLELVRERIACGYELI
ncbi:MAG: WbqC family protein [Proteobacteria bacterium]|nr:WbqC family protein [Pseudomonadota bacterium]